MSVRKILNTDQMNSHNSIRNPARVSCSTSPCIWRPLRPGAARFGCPNIATSRYLDGGRCGLKLDGFATHGSMNMDDDLRVAQPDHVAVCQLPLLHRRVVDGGAVGGVEVRQQRDVTVPPDLQVAARHTGVRQPELGVLAATDDVGAVAQLVGAPAAVVELQGDRGPRGRVAALPVAAALRGLTILIVVPRRLAVPAAVCRSGRLAVTAVVGLLAIVLTPVALVVAATLLGVGCPWVGCGIAALIVAGRSAAIVGVLAVTLATGLAGAALAVAGVVPRAAAITAGRPLFILRVAALVGVSP